MADNSIASLAQLDNRWEISGDVLISTANELLKQSENFTLAQNTQVDFAKVTDVDTAAVSLILEWKRRAEKDNQTLSFVNLPANLVSLMRLYDVDELIN
ncbi:MAG: STAS domain-containing protein [Pseudomonadota bacterium]